jgi:hypothetical protein
MIGNVVISEVDAVMYVLSKAEKHVPYMQLLGAPKYMTLYMICRTNPRRYKQFQLYS